MPMIYFLFLLFFVILIQPNSSMLSTRQYPQDIKNGIPDNYATNVFNSEFSNLLTDLLDEKDVKDLLRLQFYTQLLYRTEPYYRSFLYITSHSDLNWQDFTDLSPPSILWTDQMH